MSLVSHPVTRKVQSESKQSFSFNILMFLTEIHAEIFVMFFTDETQGESFLRVRGAIVVK